MRAECTELETGLSYLRRLVQGRLDIVGREQERRRAGAEPVELHDVIGELPEIFSEQRRPGGLGRLPQSLEPPEPDPALLVRLDEIAGPGRLAGLLELPDGELEALAAQLDSLEREVSAHRRQMFDLIDALQAELTERYRTGRASVDSLLAEG